MGLVLDVCFWGRGASHRPAVSNGGGVGCADGRVLASTLSASRAVGLCARRFWPLAAFCALHVLAAMVWTTGGDPDASVRVVRHAATRAMVKASREQMGWGDNWFGFQSQILIPVILMRTNFQNVLRASLGNQLNKR